MSSQGLEYDTVVLADDFSFEPLVGGRENLRGSGENVSHGSFYNDLQMGREHGFTHVAVAQILRRISGEQWNSGERERRR